MRTRAVRVRQKRGGAGGFRVAVPAATSCAVLLALALAQMWLVQVLLVARVGHTEGGSSGGDDGSDSVGAKSKYLREKNGADEEHRMRIEPVQAGGAGSGGDQRVKDEADTSWSLVGEVASLWSGSAPMPMDTEWTASDADTDDDANVTLVLTHCDMDLHWLPKYASGVRVRRLVVLSKCGQDLRVHGRAVRAGDLLPDVDDCALERPPNVGRCDHAIADYMDRIASSSVPSEDGDIVVFLKDSLDAQRGRMETRSLREGIRIARSRGFGCLRPPGSARSDALSSLHLTEEMARLFKKREYRGLVRSDNDNAAFASRYENMAAWLRDLGLTLPRPYTPVCYGGMFAVTMERIRSVPRGRFAAIRDSLSRGDNVEEGHYAERTWEGLLAIPIRQDLARLTAAALATHVYVEAEDGDNWRLGALARDCRGHYKLPLKDAGNWAGCPATLHELAGQH